MRVLVTEIECKNDAALVTTKIKRVDEGIDPYGRDFYSSYRVDG